MQRFKEVVYRLGGNALAFGTGLGVGFSLIYFTLYKDIQGKFGQAIKITKTLNARVSKLEEGRSE